MPIYEYRCARCHKKTTLLILTQEEKEVPTCRSCGSLEMTRLFSTFATVKSEEARLESLADPSVLAGLDEKDPRSMARWMKKMGKEIAGETGEDVDQLVEEALSETEKGEENPSAGDDL